MRRWYSTNKAAIEAGVAAVIGIISITVVIILWLFATFPTKEAVAIKDQTLIEKVEVVDRKVDKLDVKIEKIDDRTVEILREMRKP
jgi:hypothetical protein